MEIKALYIVFSLVKTSQTRHNKRGNDLSESNSGFYPAKAMFFKSNKEVYSPLKSLVIMHVVSNRHVGQSTCW